MSAVPNQTCFSPESTCIWGRPPSRNTPSTRAECTSLSLGDYALDGAYSPHILGTNARCTTTALSSPTASNSATERSLRVVVVERVCGGGRTCTSATSPLRRCRLTASRAMPGSADEPLRTQPWVRGGSPSISQQSCDDCDMTLSLAWIRILNPNISELLFASDSRLSGGNRFDYVAKLFPLPRTDCGMAFAGSTYWAYPMMTALVRATEIHRPAATHALPLRQYFSHLLQILNEMQQAVHSYAEGENIPDFTLTVGGWDWKELRFRIWQIDFDTNTMKFTLNKRESIIGVSTIGACNIAGDTDAVGKARKLLKERLQSKYGRDMRSPGAHLNLEPFEVLRDMLRESGSDSTIGGSPQLMKVYQHMNTQVHAVMWPRAGVERPYYLGRPLLDYERADGLWAFNPDTLVSSMISGSRRPNAYSDGSEQEIE